MHLNKISNYAVGLLVLESPLARALVPRSRPAALLSNVERATANACQSLSDSLPDQTFFPNTTQYVTESTHVWSETCILTPNCVFEPTSAQNLSTGLKLIKKANSKFAVRSGGHMPVPGAQSIDDGVMISLSGLNTKQLNADKSIMEIGSGNLWIDVYDYLSPYGLAVNGGRYPSVGVGGLLLGGGIGYFSGRQGWGCDNVVRYEVVLADGSIVNVTDDGDYNDLFWALKGGSNHFGIVTRFDVRTLPISSVYGGIATWSGQEAGNAIFRAMDAYLAPGGGVEDPDVHITSFYGIQPNSTDKDISYSVLVFYPGTSDDPAPLTNFTAMTRENVLSNSLLSNGIAVHDEWTAVAEQFTAFASNTDRDLFATIGFLADPRAVRIHNTTVIEGAARELSHVQGLQMYASYQPVSQGYLEASKNAAPGGNALGLEPSDEGTFIVGRIDAIWQNEEDDDAVNAYTAKAIASVKSQLQKLNLWKNFEYINDAQQGQRPFASYGNGKNLPILKQIRDKYDPEGFLKNNLQHGFPLE